MKIIATNRKARKDYQILENFEVGIELRGTEVKSLRSRACSIEEAFVKIEAEEAYIYNMHVPEFVKSSFFLPIRFSKLFTLFNLIIYDFNKSSLSAYVHLVFGLSIY